MPFIGFYCDLHYPNVNNMNQMNNVIKTLFDDS